MIYTVQLIALTRASYASQIMLSALSVCSVRDFWASYNADTVTDCATLALSVSKHLFSHASLLPDDTVDTQQNDVHRILADRNPNRMT